MGIAQQGRKMRLAGRRKVQLGRHSTPTKMFDGRARRPVVESLREFMRAYGQGSEGHKARLAFAARLGTSTAYLVQLGLGYRQCSLAMALAIEQQTHGLVSAEEMCPSANWDYINRRSLRSNAYAQALSA